MKKILFPTDFSETALNAFHYALELASRSGADLHLLNVFKIPIVDANMPGELINQMNQELREQSRKHLESLVKNTLLSSGKYDFDKINFKYEVKQGFPVDEIIYTAGQLEVDMIIMGTTGASGFKEIVIGSNTSKLIGKVKIPVLAIPAKATLKPFKKIIYASDFDEKDKFALTQLVDFARFFDAQITVLHVIENYEIVSKEKVSVLRKTVREELGYEKINIEFKVYGNLFEGVEDFLKNEEADCLATLTRKRNFFEKLFHRSFTRKMAFHSNIPLLAFSQ